MKSSKYKEALIGAGYVNQLLHYDPVTGLFTRKINRGRTKVGDIAGWVEKDGYRRIEILGMNVLAHRLAWLCMTGSWPEGDVDHKNGMGDDNRWDNLRTGSKSFNLQNQRKAKIDNKTGLLGVTERDGKFRARIQTNGKTVALGYCATAEDAHAAYLSAKRKLHESCTI